MPKLPQFKEGPSSFQLMQTRWGTLIDPVISNPINQGNLIQNVVLSSSSIINHGLGRNLQGWFLTRLRGNATVFDRQDINTIPDKTLLLTASSGVPADIYVF